MSRSRPSGGGQVKIQFDPDDPTQHITKSGAVHTLTDEQQLFAQTYVENGGDHLAAYAAAYGPNKGGTWARMVIREPSVQRYIQHLKRTRAIPPAEANKLIAELNLPTKTRREERTNGRRVFKAAVKILDRTGILPADAAKTVFDVSRQGVPKPGNAPGAAQEPVHAIETFSAPPDRQEPPQWSPERAEVSLRPPDPVFNHWEPVSQPAFVFSHENFRQPSAEEIKAEARSRRPTGNRPMNPFTGR